MKLRAWQEACIREAIRLFQAGQRHFLCLATPGAGKTHMASTLAAKLLASGQIDFVVCFAPSKVVAVDFQSALEEKAGKRMNGLIGARGVTLTYQAMLTQKDDFWALFKDHRVLAIFDEIHHCAGQEVFDANAWGERVISHIQDQATFTLALTGTPWRSDQRPIVLANYGSKGVSCDYSYGLQRAIDEGVCRIPQLTLIDNDKVTVHKSDEAESFGSLAELLSSEACSYEDILRSDEMITYCLKKAAACLNSVRRRHPDAGGLIVAASVEHARQIAKLLEAQLNETAAIATYRDHEPAEVIKRFKTSTDKWIISVGMISEGTNVPRLRVCCHLTRIRTELYFRQVLGRILRANGVRGDRAYFYMPAEPTLVEYAHRLAIDVPATLPIVRDTGPKGVRITTDTQSGGKLDIDVRFGGDSIGPDEIGFPDNGITQPSNPTGGGSNSPLSVAYEQQLVWSDRFRGDVLSVLGIPQ